MTTNKPDRPALDARLRHLVVILLGLILTATPAFGKLPTFTLTVEPNPPVAGEATRVSATFDISFGIEEIRGLLVLHRAAEEQDQNVIAITLQQVDSTQYEATVVIPEEGNWVLKAFPDRTGWATQEIPPGYPDTLDLVVVAPPTAASTQAKGNVAHTSILEAVFILVSLAGLGSWLVHRGISSKAARSPSNRRRHTSQQARGDPKSRSASRPA
jgi:hypothetical protein